jgi:S-adenosylmethionine/arginine decarboxylase-like enzyme
MAKRMQLMRREISAIQQPKADGTRQGLHLLGEWFRCRGRPELFDNAVALRGVCHGAARDAGLTVVGELFHRFPSSGVTGTLVLVDSHLVINARLDGRSATLDVFIVGRAPGDRLKAHALYASLRDRLSPEKENFLQINRGGSG